MTTRSWMIGPLTLLALACAPAHAVASAPTRAPSTAPTTVSTPARSTTAPSSTTREEARPIPVRGATVVDVGSGQSLNLHTDGAIDLDGHELRRADDYQLVRAYQTFVTRDDIVLALGTGSGVTSQRTDLVDLYAIDPDTRERRWRSIVAPHYAEGEQVSDWRVLTARNRLLLVEDHRVIAIDARTGKQLWTFWLYAPQFAKLFLGSNINPDLPALQVDGARVRGRELVLDVRLGDDREPTKFELDVDSGRRVYVEGRRDAPVETKLSEFAQPVLQHTTAYYDDPPPPPPPKPLQVPGHDGLAIGTTLLLWNVRSGHGVIVNPNHDALGEVLARARALRIDDGSGKPVAIHWDAVLDTGAIADSVARDRSKPPLVRKDGVVQFDYGLVNRDSVDVVDAPALARTLGAPAVTSYKARPKSIGLHLVREPDDYTSIRVSWGPFELDDTNTPVNDGYVTPL